MDAAPCHIGAVDPLAPFRSECVDRRRLPAEGGERMTATNEAPPVAFERAEGMTTCANGTLFAGLPPRKDDPAILGEAGKAHAFGLFEAHGEAFLRRARREFLRHILAAPDGLATVEEIRGRVPAPRNPKAWGPVASQLATLGIIERAAYKKTVRAEAHARPVSLWRLVDPEAARAWIAAHEEPAPACPEKPERLGTVLDRLPELQEAAHA
jgi:hypothetical protein